MNNEMKQTLLGMSKKFISDWTEKLNTELTDLKVHSKPETLDSCIELANKIKEELEKLKSTLST